MQDSGINLPSNILLTKPLSILREALSNKFCHLRYHLTSIPEGQN